MLPSCFRTISTPASSRPRALRRTVRPKARPSANLLRHVAALNALPAMHWPETVGGQSSGLGSTGRRIGRPLGLVLGGDVTDDGGGQVAPAARGNGSSSSFRASGTSKAPGADSVHFPVYAGLGQPRPRPGRAAARVSTGIAANCATMSSSIIGRSVFYKPPVPVTNYDVADRIAIPGIGAGCISIQLTSFRWRRTSKGAADAACHG